MELSMKFFYFSLCTHDKSMYLQDWSNDYSTTTAPYGGHTTASPRSGCVLPQQPTGGSFEVGGCETPPCNSNPGTRVPIGGYLTYTCNEGYTLKGNNVSFCHNGTWYLPPTCGSKKIHFRQKLLLYDEKGNVSQLV